MPGTTPSQALTSGRETIRSVAALHRTVNPGIYGFVLTGSDREDSDLDVLVEPLPETTLSDYRAQMVQGSTDAVTFAESKNGRLA